MKSKLLFAKRDPSTREQIIKELEKSIQKLYDESIILKSRGNYYSAKDKASIAFEKFIEFKSKNSEMLTEVASCS